MLTVDIEKAFDSVNNLFLVSALEKYSFKNDFTRWIKLLLKNQELCIINGGQATNYFKLERGTRQGGSLSAYLFILILRIAFIKTKRNPDIKNLNVCNNDSVIMTFYILHTLMIPLFFYETKKLQEKS